MELMHYSNPYKIIANRAQNRAQEVAESSRSSIEFAESESTGIMPREYFGEAFVYPIRELIARSSDEEVICRYQQIIDYISSELESVGSEIVRTHREYVALLDEVKNEGCFNKVLEYYGGEKASLLCMYANCKEISQALEEVLKLLSDNELRTRTTDFLKKFDSYFLEG